MRIVLGRLRERRLANGARLIAIGVPPDVEPEGALLLWSALHDLLRPRLARLLAGQPQLAWEIVAGRGGSEFRLWVPGGVPPGLVERTLAAAWPALLARKPDFVKANNLGILVYGWAADWPDGFGFLSQIVDSRVIRDAGNTNLGIVDPKIDALVDQALVTGDAAGREKVWAGIDKQVMDDAFVIPGIWAKGLLYRPPTLTNVFVTDGYSMYDYAAMGTTRQ